MKAHGDCCGCSACMRQVSRQQACMRVHGCSRPLCELQPPSLEPPPTEQAIHPFDLGFSPSCHEQHNSQPNIAREVAIPKKTSRKRLFGDNTPSAPAHAAPAVEPRQKPLNATELYDLSLSQLSVVPDTQQRRALELLEPDPTPKTWQQLLTGLPPTARQLLCARLSHYQLGPEATASGRQALGVEHHAQGLFGKRNPPEDPCWVDESAICTTNLKQLGIARCHHEFGDQECAQMLEGLLRVMQRWHRSTDGLHFLDEHNKYLPGTKRSGKGGPAACIMKRLLALTRRRVQLGQHAAVLQTFQGLVRALQQRFPTCLSAGMYSYELQDLVHQVLIVQRNWRSETGYQKEFRAVQMLKDMVNKVAQLGDDNELNLEHLMQQLLADYHPQTELVHDRLQGHAKHLLKFGKDSYDQLQYDAVVANTNQALLINAGPGSGKTTVMALRALYLIGCLLHSSQHVLSAAYDHVVALTFSRRAQQHMKQTLDGFCVRMTHNHTFDGLWLRMAHEFRHQLGKPRIKVNGQDDVRLILSEHIEKTVQQQYNQGQCQLKAEGEEWKYLLLSIADLLAHQLQEVFVDKVGLGVYKFQDVWQQPPLRRHILEVFWSNPGVTYSLRHSNLPLDKRTLEVAVTKAVSALVDSFQEEDAAVWELLGYATLIWHTATGQRNSAPAEQQAAKQVFDYWSSRQAWLLDEFQDVSHAQYRLLKALTCGGQRKRVTIVGDADQAIYDWRGADVRLFEEQFATDYSPVTNKTLEVNYRSTAQIVNHSNALIAHNYKTWQEPALQHLNRAANPKPLAAAASIQDTEPVHFVQYSSPHHECIDILDKIHYWHTRVWTDRAGLKQGPGVPYSQIRILARARWQLFHIKKFLDKNGLNTVLLGDNSGLEDEDADLVELPESEDLEDKDEQVMLSTVHAVKGLECVVCFVVGLDDRTWKTNFVPTTPAEAKQIRESRNVAYVAMTRAERALYLSCACRSGQAHADPTTFFTEAMLSGDWVVRYNTS